MMQDRKQSDDGDATRVITATANLIQGTQTVTAIADIRRNFSSQHLNAAKHFANELRIHEKKHADAGFGPHFSYCIWNASAAIIMSFSAIEAALDEAEDDLALPYELTAVLNRAPTLERAQALLAHMGKTPFEKGQERFQTANLLRALRNGLIHPKAEWDSKKVRNKKLSKMIVAAGLGLSPFHPDPKQAFPHGCMSADVASWAVSSARNFIHELRSRLGLKSSQ